MKTKRLLSSHLEQTTFHDTSTEHAKSKAIHEWSVADRPREKLADKGPQALTNAELLAILIGSGSIAESAVSLMQRLMSDCQDSLRKVGKLSIEDLCRYKGIGMAKAITILAACELGKRRAAESPEKRPKMNHAEAAFRFFAPKMEDLHHEEFHVLFLNHQLEMIKSQCISQGGMTETVVDVRMLAAQALQYKATHIIICHNHPSGNPSPSKHDDQITHKIKSALQLLDILLVDHIIIGDKNYYSYAEQGIL